MKFNFKKAIEKLAILRSNCIFSAKEWKSIMEENNFGEMGNGFLFDLDNLATYFLRKQDIFMCIVAKEDLINHLLYFKQQQEIKREIRCAH